MDAKLVERINALAAKAKTEGLTPEEETERAMLRKKYLEEFKAGFKHNILDNLYVMDENGNKIKVSKRK